jgi:3-hydroxyisobutyrate dehydrogenase-like beta-hydroxyacid dehydrogenase
MGAPIAAALQRVHPLAVYDLDPARVRAVVGDDVRRCESANEVAASCDVLVSVLPGPGDVAEVADQVLPALLPGAVWIDCTSGSPETSRRLAVRAEQHGVGVVSAPIGGSVADAEAAQLVLYVSGSDSAVTQVVPLLAHLAAPDGIHVVGTRAEDAQVVKLLANALWFANAAAASEAMLIGTALGLPAEHLHHLLRDSAGASRFLSRDMGRLLDGDYMTTFGIDRVVEELRAVATMRDAVGVVTPVLDASAVLHEGANEHFGPALGELLGVALLEVRAKRQLRR